jgi:hypothetical protein
MNARGSEIFWLYVYYDLSQLKEKPVHNVARPLIATKTICSEEKNIIFG